MMALLTEFLNWTWMDIKWAWVGIGVILLLVAAWKANKIESVNLREPLSQIFAFLFAVLVYWDRPDATRIFSFSNWEPRYLLIGWGIPLAGLVAILFFGLNRREQVKAAIRGMMGKSVSFLLIAGAVIVARWCFLKA